MKDETSPDTLTAIEISLEDVVKGKPLTPGTTDLPTLREFLEDIEKLVSGNAPQQPLKGASNIEITEGSLAVKLMVSAWIATSFTADMKKLESTGDLDAIASRRAQVIQSWQRRTSKNQSRVYNIRPLGPNTKPIQITKNTSFQHKKENAWVSVEKYLHGEVTDWGGDQKPNIHLKLENQKKVTVNAKREQIVHEKENKVYSSVTLRVAAQENIITKELRDIRLLEFTPSSSEIDYKALEALWEKGKKAWADVESPTQWVEEIRGNI